MCLFGKSPAWEDEVVFANRKHGRKHRTRVTETTIHRKEKYVSPPPRTPTPTQTVISASPPRAPSPVPSHKPAPPPPPPQPTIEFISVEEDKASSSGGPRSSKISVSKKSRHGSRGGEEVYIERERVRERIPPPQDPEYDTFRYVEAPMPPRRDYDALEEERTERRRSRSITYQSNPRMSSGRVTERERVVIEDGGRRREYYRKP